MTPDLENPYNDLPEGDPIVDPSGTADVDSDLLRISKETFEASTSWLEASVTKDWQDNIAHFQNRHASSSKFNSEGYKKRNRLFWPKTRSAVRSTEAAWAQAAFSGAEVVTAEPINDSDEWSRAAASVHEAMLRYRLDKTIPWFLTSTGALQDALVYNICVSYQYWEKEVEEVTVPIPGVLNEDGSPSFETKRVVNESKPCIDLMAPDNLRIDPAADWRDPINTSPYVIRLVPMHVSDVLAKMDKPGSNWRKYSESDLLAAQSQYYDGTRREREDGRQDPHDSGTGEFKIIWLHENYVRRNGKDMVWWTVGTQLVLSDPYPIQEVYLHGKRPIVVGMASFDAHRLYPDSPTKMSGSMQVALNEVNNQRLDNVSLALNKRYILRRGQQFDLNALMRNVPGGGIMADDPDRDIRVLETPDVTSSSYAEQDRMNVQFDEIIGSFSQSSVQSSRQLNETVGGMNLLSGSAGLISEYTLRVFVETWVEPVLRQLVELEKYYEDDKKLIFLAGREAGLYLEGLQDPDLQDLLMQGCIVRVGVGMGATNPMQRVERLMTGINAVANIPGAIERLNFEAVSSEVFHALGYRDASRFFKDEQELGEPGPSPEQMKVEAQQQMHQMDLEFKAAVEEANRAFRAQDLALQQQIASSRSETDRLRAQAEVEIQLRRLAQEREMRLADIAARHELTMAQLNAKVGLEQTKFANSSEIELLRDRTKRETTALVEQNKQNEMRLKQVMGSGI